jgi:phage gp36-like protein
MAYATLDDLVLSWDSDVVSRLSIRPEDPDGSQTVGRALDNASALIDAQLSVRFTLPVPTVSPILVKICVDLAVAEMAIGADLMTDIIDKRESRARADLKLIAEGKMNLGLPTASTSESDRPKPIFGPGGAKLFTRDRLRGL